MDHTNQNIIVSLHGVVKQMRKQILLILKKRRVNPVHTHSSVQIVKEIIKLTWINTYSENTISIVTGITKSKINFMKIEGLWFAQL